MHHPPPMPGHHETIPEPVTGKQVRNLVPQQRQILTICEKGVTEVLQCWNRKEQQIARQKRAAEYISGRRNRSIFKKLEVLIRHCVTSWEGVSCQDRRDRHISAMR